MDYYTNNGQQDPNGNNTSFEIHPARAVHRLDTNRNFILVAILSFITCGIYNYFFLGKLLKDIDIACDGDGKAKNIGVGELFLYSILTCGVFSTCIEYVLVERMRANATRYGLDNTYNGKTHLLWNTVGITFCGMGPFVGLYFLCLNSNAICDAYNRANGF